MKAKKLKGIVRRWRADGSEAHAGIAGLCRKDFIALSNEATVGDAISQLRRSAVRGNIFYLYLTDRAGKLVGNVSIRTLLTSTDETPLGRIGSREVVTLPISSPIQEAYHLFARARFLSLPVVSDDNVLLGVIHAHELLEEFGKKQEDLFEERSRGELFELLGIKAEDAGKGPAHVALGRLPWLLVNIVGGTCSALFIHFLGGNLKHAVEFLAFVPILLIVSESIGMQTASLVIANLHRAASRSRTREILAREMLVACLLGLTCAALVAGAVQLWKGMPALSVAVLVTIFVGSVAVSFLGNAVPYLFHRFKVDPRVAAGPVVLALADSTTLLFYLLFALWITR